MNRQFIIFSIVFANLLTAIHAFGQSAGNVISTSRIEISLHGEITLDSLSNFFRQHTDIRFSFNSNKIKGNRVIAFAARKYDLNALLHHIKETTGLIYFPYDKHIIFMDKRRPPENSIPTHHPADSKTRSYSKTPLIHKKSVDNTRHSTKSPTVRYALADSTKQNPIRLAMLKNDTIRIRQALLTFNTAIIPKSNTPKRPAVTNSTRFRVPWYLQAGVFFSDALYINPSVEAGIKPIHLLFSWSTDLHIKGWGFGLGSVIADKAGGQWQITTTFCPLQVGYQVDSGLTVSSIEVKGRLYNAAITWGKHFDRHLLLKIGLTANALHTTYYNNGLPTPLNQYFTVGENPDTKFYLVRPPLLLRNTFKSNEANNQKIWMGLSVGLYYDLNFSKE